jgi:hypothetical protein
MIDHELHSPFKYLSWLVDNVSGTTSPHEGGSTQVQVGVSVTKSVIPEPPTEPVERFLASLRFEHHDKLAELPIDLSEEV